MSAPSDGIVYVATKKDRYLAEAFLSARSAKRLMPGVSITLFTNLIDSGFAGADCFDQVVPIDTIEAFDRSWSEGQLDRIRCLPHSPYERTLHLDCDTRVRSADVASAFQLLDRHDVAMVECNVDNSWCCEHYGRPMFNVGFILYRKSEGVMRLLQEWSRLTESFFGLARGEGDPELEFLAHIDDPDRRRKLLFMDQLSMVRLLSPEGGPEGLDCKILDESWNYRGSNAGRPPPPEIRVDHHPLLRTRDFVRDMVVASVEYQQAGDLDFGLELLQWIDQEEPGNINVMKMLVLCQLQRNERADAVLTLDRMLAHFPGYAWAENARSRIAQMPTADPH
ncbi:MAG: hypothetical protein PVG91_05710 [Gammaproteobacteria bacterium]|jgi:hypothetical protein